MNSNIAKEASAKRIISKSVKELAENLSKSGVKVKGGVSDVVNNEIKSDFGLAGVLGGAMKGVAKKGYKVSPKVVKSQLDKGINKVRPVVNKASQARYNVDKAVSNLDMKAGAIGHKYAPGKSKELFVKKKKIEIEPKNKLGAKEYMEKEIASGVEPLRKARNVVVPVAGGMYLTDKMEKLKYNPAEENESSQFKSAKSREELIDKVANLIQNDNVEQIKKAASVDKSIEMKMCLDRMTKLASQASEQLKQASLTQEALMNKIASLEMEVSLLKSSETVREKTEKATKLAEEMLEKGMIKLAEYDCKVDELTKLDDVTFDVLQNTVDNVPFYKEAFESAGVSSLSFMMGDAEDRKRKKTMLETFSE